MIKLELGCLLKQKNNIKLNLNTLKINNIRFYIACHYFRYDSENSRILCVYESA